MSAESEVLETIIIPALNLLPPNMDTPAARVMMLTICGQEAAFKHRFQVLNDPTKKGPARGLWQFESGGGVKGVLNHQASRDEARAACTVRSINPDDRNAVWLGLESSDVLAAIFARLLLWTDPKRIPEIGDEEGAYQLYLRTWRPGAYERGDAKVRADLRRKWSGYYERAMVAAGV